MRHHFIADAVAIIGTMDLVFGLVSFYKLIFLHTNENICLVRWTGNVRECRLCIKFQNALFSSTNLVDRLRSVNEGTINLYEALLDLLISVWMNNTLLLPHYATCCEDIESKASFVQRRNSTDVGHLGF